MIRSILPGLLLLGAALPAQTASDLEALRAALGDFASLDGWIYEDVAKGYREAKKTGKPLLVAFR